MYIFINIYISYISYVYTYIYIYILYMYIYISFGKGPGPSKNNHPKTISKPCWPWPRSLSPRGDCGREVAGLELCRRNCRFGRWSLDRLNPRGFFLVVSPRWSLKPLGFVEKPLAFLLVILKVTSNYDCPWLNASDNPESLTFFLVNYIVNIPMISPWCARFFA